MFLCLYFNLNLYFFFSNYSGEFNVVKLSNSGRSDNVFSGSVKVTFDSPQWVETRQEVGGLK